MRKLRPIVKPSPERIYPLLAPKAEITLWSLLFVSVFAIFELRFNSKLQIPASLKTSYPFLRTMSLYKWMELEWHNRAWIRRTKYW